MRGKGIGHIYAIDQATPVASHPHVVANAAMLRR